MNPIKVQFVNFKRNFAIIKNSPHRYCKFTTFIDCMFSGLKYGASVSDYFEFEFYRKKSKERKKFACYKLKKKFMHTLNDYSKAKLFDNKVNFLKTFNDFIGRDWLEVEKASLEEFGAFCSKYPSFIAKAQNLSCGNGIRKITVSENVEELYQELKAEQALVEEIIVQHPVMASLYENAVNTIRISSAYINGQVHVLGAVLRCGSGTGCIDNYRAGGFACKVDSNTGVVISNGCNVHHDRPEKHPNTNMTFKGFQIPHWDKLLETLSKAVNVVEGVRYTGWDFAIRENDVVLVEGNFEGMFNILQQPADEGIKEEVLALLEQVK